MTNKAYEYAQGMHDLHVSRDLIQQVNGILEAVPQVRELILKILQCQLIRST